MEIRLFNFVKRENSTARPSGEGRKFNCKLKSETSVINPEILIDFADQDDPGVHIFNYAYIPSFNRYYFINDMRVDAGMLWEYSLTVDILGTYRDVISVSYLYLLRCSRDYDGSIVDNYYPVKSSHHVVRKSAPVPWIHRSGTENISLTDGVYILGIVAKPYTTGAGSFGSVMYYAVRQSQMLQLITQLMDNTITTGHGFSADNATLSLQKSLIDPLSWIKSCIWMPLLYEGVEGTEMSTLHVWDWELSMTCKLITKDPPYVINTVSFTLDQHPQALTRGSYLNLSPFTRLSVSCPPFGLIDIDTAGASQASQLRLQIVTDLITGQSNVEVRADELLLQRFSSQTGVQIQLSQVSYDYTDIPTTLTGTAAEAINSWFGSVIPSGISNAVSQIGNAANAMRTRSSSIGGNGNFADLRGIAYLYQDFYDIPDEDRAHAGRPLCREVYMHTMQAGAYCLAAHGDIAINGTAEEQQQLKTLLEGGFFYE